MWFWILFKLMVSLFETNKNLYFSRSWPKNGISLLQFAVRQCIKNFWKCLVTTRCTDPNIYCSVRRNLPLSSLQPFSFNTLGNRAEIMFRKVWTKWYLLILHWYYSPIVQFRLWRTLNILNPEWQIQFKLFMLNVVLREVCFQKISLYGQLDLLLDGFRGGGVPRSNSQRSLHGHLEGGRFYESTWL